MTLVMPATEPLLWVSFNGADEARAMGIRVLVYVVTAVIVVIFAGKNLGRKDTLEVSADTEKAAVPA